MGKREAGAGGEALPDIAVPRQLFEHLREGRLVFFAGAGLSVQAGLPTWRALIEEVVQRTVAEAVEGEQASAELASMLAAGKWLQIADHCKEKLGPGGYARLLAERLSDAGRPVPEVHRLAVRLPFAAWITTNYDKLLERAYAEERGGLPKTLTNLDTAALGQLLFDGAPFVLKAHGDLDRPESLVFTSRDYRDHIHANTAFSAAFSAVLLTHSVLFVGYSLSDPDFNLLLDRQLLTFQGFVPERYALMSGIGKVEEEYLWRVCRIRVIPYSEGRHDSVPHFFQQLADRLALATGAAAASHVVAGPRLQSAVGPDTRAGLAGARQEAVLTERTVSSRRTAAKVPPIPLVLSLAWTDGSVQTTLTDGARMLASASVAADAWSTLAAESRRLESGRAGTLAVYGAALAQMLGEAPVARLAAALDGSGSRCVRLELTRQTERVPWELVTLGSRPLAERAPVFRAPVGVSERARGLPSIGVPLRVLVVADTTAADSPPTGLPLGPLPGAAAEAREVGAIIERSGAGSVRLLLGAEATYETVAAAFEDFQPDVFHFAGHAWFDDREAYLVLADAYLTSSMMRPWLTRRSPALMFLNSHFTAFVPAGVEANLGGGHTAAVQGGLGGRAGFSDLAMRCGVGAFVGSFSGAIDDQGARDFAVSIYDSLLRGATLADAVHAPRGSRAQAGVDATALLYCAYGAGDLRLVPGGTKVAAPRPLPAATSRHPRKPGAKKSPS